MSERVWCNEPAMIDGRGVLRCHLRADHGGIHAFSAPPPAGQEPEPLAALPSGSNIISEIAERHARVAASPDYTPGRYVRSEAEAEQLLARDRRIVVAMRRGGSFGRVCALAAVEIKRRGYVIGWDSVAGAAVALAHRISYADKDDSRPAALAVAEAILDSGAGDPEPTRDEDVALWAWDAARFGDGFEDDERDVYGRELKRRDPRYWGMGKRKMRDALERGACVDVSECDRTRGVDGYYILTSSTWRPGVDYCDANLEHWIQSIGRHLPVFVMGPNAGEPAQAAGELHAALSSILCHHPNYECVWPPNRAARSSTSDKMTT